MAENNAKTTGYSKRSAWEEQWETPTLPKLLEVYDDEQKQIIVHQMNEIEALGQMRQEFKWYGNSWKWTIEYLFDDHKGKEQTLAYVVPALDSMMIWVPLLDDEIAELPLKRLTKFVREAIRIANFAFEVHWAKWSPNSVGEVNLLMELIKRKRKRLVTGGKASKDD